MVLELADGSPDLLDMETGGGEWLRGRPAAPPRTVALEAWSPNVGLAAANLRPVDIAVVHDEGSVDNVDQLGAPPPPL